MKGYFTTRRGKRKSRSEKQHKFLHARGLDHTHHIGERTSRETYQRGKLKVRRRRKR